MATTIRTQDRLRESIAPFLAFFNGPFARLNANPARKDYKQPIEVKVGKNRRKQCNLYDPDGNRVELMEDHTVDGLPAPMTPFPLFP